MEEYKALVRDLGNAIINWARPDGWPTGTDGQPLSPFASYPLTSSESAFTIALCYLLFATIGSTYVFSKDNDQSSKKSIPEAGIQAYRNNYTLIPCNKFNHTHPPLGDVLYIFYLSKILDFADTIFIVVEKRKSQLSFLHVYHHFTIFLFYWLNINVGYDGDVYLTIFLNGLIHTIMYTYYFLTLHEAKIPWKQFLTLSQIGQFILMNSQALYLIGTGCKEFPYNITMAYLWYIVTLIILFTHFFVTAYGSSAGKNKKYSKKE